MKLTLPLNIEVPQDPVKFNMGLMFRENLEQDSGMLFIFNEVGEKSFHMKDTKIPLDIAFINEEGIIESIKELEPLNLEPVYSDSDVLYALEVNRGWFKENDVKVGDNIFESDLIQKRKQLRQKQVEKVKKFRQSNQSSSDAIEKQNDREQMKKEIKKELSQESMNIEHSNGTTFARVMDIIGPTHMRPLVSNGVWKGTEQIIEKKSDCECDDCGQDPCIECGESHHNVKEQMEKDNGVDDQQQKQIDSKQKKADQIKKQVLLKKLQAVRQGGGSEIMASYSWRDDKNMRINKILNS